MLCRKNDLGWRLRRHIGGGYTISRKGASFASRLWQWGPLLTYVTLVVAFRGGGETVVRYGVYAIPLIFLLGWFTAKRVFLRGFLATIPAGFLLYELLLGTGRMGAFDVYLTLGLAFLVCGPWVFFPHVLNIPVKLGYVTDWYLSPRRPFFRIGVHIGQDAETGVYGVYLKARKSTPPAPPWEVLAWESSTEDEARAVAAELCSWGIGALGARSDLVAEDS